MQKLSHLNSSTLDKDGVLETTISFGWLDYYHSNAYQSRQIVYSTLESVDSPTNVWIVGTMIDAHVGNVKRYVCYPVLEIWDESMEVHPDHYNSALTHVKTLLNLVDINIVNKEELLTWCGVELTFSNDGLLAAIRHTRDGGGIKLSTTILQAAGIEVNEVLPKLYHKLDHTYTRDLPSLCRHGRAYFNVEFTKYIDLLGHYDIVGYDYGLQVRTLPRFYEIDSSGKFATNTITGESVALGII